MGSLNQMAWFVNHYHCETMITSGTETWSCKAKCALIHWELNKLDAILNTIFWNALFWKNTIVMILGDHNHWFCKCIGTGLTATHCLNQWWTSTLTDACVTSCQCIKWAYLQLLCEILPPLNVPPYHVSTVWSGCNIAMPNVQEMTW